MGQFLKGVVCVCALLCSHLSYSQCGPCTTTISSNTGGFTVPAGDTTCLYANGSDVTVSGAITIDPDDGVLKICSQNATDTVYITDRILQGSGSSALDVVLLVEGNLVQDAGGLSQFFGNKFTIEISGYYRVEGQVSNDSKATTITTTGQYFVNGNDVILGGTTIVTNDGIYSVDGTLTNPETFINNGELNIGGDLDMGGSMTNNAPNGVINIGGNFDMFSGANLDNVGGFINVGDNMNINGTMTNTGGITVDSSLSINSGSGTDISGGSFYSRDLFITKGDFLTGGADCANFYVTDSSFVSSSPSFSGSIHIQDASLSGGDTLDFNDCTSPTNCLFTAGSDDGGCNNILVPVLWGKLEVKSVGNNYQLQWTTLIEENNDRFEILYSTDGVNYIVIDEVQGSGNSNTIKHYTYVHHSPNESAANHYYRIRQVDYDNSYSYSPVIVSSAEELTLISMYPNPSFGVVNLAYETPVDKDISVQVFDVLGKLRANENYSLSAGATVIQMDIAYLPNGHYIIVSTDVETGLTVFKNLKLN